MFSPEFQNNIGYYHKFSLPYPGLPNQTETFFTPYPFVILRNTCDKFDNVIKVDRVAPSYQRNEKDSYVIKYFPHDVNCELAELPNKEKNLFLALAEIFCGELLCAFDPELVPQYRLFTDEKYTPMVGSEWKENFKGWHYIWDNTNLFRINDHGMISFKLNDVWSEFLPLKGLGTGIILRYLLEPIDEIDIRGNCGIIPANGTTRHHQFLLIDFGTCLSGFVNIEAEEKRFIKCWQQELKNLQKAVTKQGLFHYLTKKVFEEYLDDKEFPEELMKIGYIQAEMQATINALQNFLPTLNFLANMWLGQFQNEKASIIRMFKTIINKLSRFARSTPNIHTYRPRQSLLYATPIPQPLSCQVCHINIPNASPISWIPGNSIPQKMCQNCFVNSFLR